MNRLPIVQRLYEEAQDDPDRLLYQAAQVIEKLHKVMWEGRRAVGQLHAGKLEDDDYLAITAFYDHARKLHRRLLEAKHD